MLTVCYLMLVIGAAGSASDERVHCCTATATHNRMCLVLRSQFAYASGEIVTC